VIASLGDSELVSFRLISQHDARASGAYDLAISPTTAERAITLPCKTISTLRLSGRLRWRNDVCKKKIKPQLSIPRPLLYPQS